MKATEVTYSTVYGTDCMLMPRCPFKPDANFNFFFVGLSRLLQAAVASLARTVLLGQISH